MDERLAGRWLSPRVCPTAVTRRTTYRRGDRGRPRDAVVALVEQLGLVASAAQQVAEHAPVYREYLVEQLAELAASPVVMLAEEVATLRDDEASDVRGART
jgi:hypothetical protein